MSLPASPQGRHHRSHPPFVGISSLTPKHDCESLRMGRVCLYVFTRSPSVSWIGHTRISAAQRAKREHRRGCGVSAWHCRPRAARAARGCIASPPPCCRPRLAQAGRRTRMPKRSRPAPASSVNTRHAKKPIDVFGLAVFVFCHFTKSKRLGRKVSLTNLFGQNIPSDGYDGYSFKTGQFYQGNKNITNHLESLFFTI